MHYPTTFFNEGPTEKELHNLGVEDAECYVWMESEELIIFQYLKNSVSLLVFSTHSFRYRSSIFQKHKTVPFIFIKHSWPVLRSKFYLKTFYIILLTIYMSFVFPFIEYLANVCRFHSQSSLEQNKVRLSISSVSLLLLAINPLQNFPTVLHSFLAICFSQLVNYVSTTTLAFLHKTLLELISILSKFLL